MSTQIKLDGRWVTVAGGHRMWVGTTAARDAALAAGKLPDGTEVMTTDDYTPPSPPGDVYVISASNTELVKGTDDIWRCNKSFPTPLPAGLYHIVVRCTGGSNTDGTRMCYEYAMVNSCGPQMWGDTIWSVMKKYTEPINDVTFAVATAGLDGVNCGFTKVTYTFIRIA